MTRFSIDVNATKSQSTSIGSIAANLRDNSRRISSASANISQVMSGQSGTNVYASLSAAAQKLLTEAARMEDLGSALEHIAQAYERSDESAVELVKAAALTTSGTVAIPSKGSDDINGFIDGLIKTITKWVNDVISWITGGSSEGENPSEPHTPTIKEQEKAHDLAMQKEVFDLLKTDRFSKETWAKATVEERKQILMALVPAIAGVYGIHTPEHIVIKSLGANTRGSYSDKTDTVCINEDYLSQSDSYAITQTMIHEMRHAYQHEVVKNPENFTVSEETVAAWRDNFEPGHYRGVGREAPDGHRYTYEEYVTQPIEWDAKNFAKQYGDVEGHTPDYAGSWD